jgi:selenocysteine lyase/cysteine desulfurase
VYQPWLPRGHVCGRAHHGPSLKQIFSRRESLCGLFASLINAESADSISIIPSSSYGVATAVLNLLPMVRREQNVVTLGREHISNRLIWQTASRGGDAYELRVAPAPSALRGEKSWTDAVLSLIDQQTAIAAVAPCFWMDGTALDLEAVGARCRDVGAALVVDGTQCVGASPFDVRAVGADFLVCSGYKWLLCPYGVSFLYAAPKHYEDATGPKALEEHGWDSRDSGPGKATWGDPEGESRDGINRRLTAYIPDDFIGSSYSKVWCLRNSQAIWGPGFLT